MTCRRALTLVELLVALGLLTVVVVATGSWLQISGRSTSVAQTTTGFESAAGAVLRLIEEDIAVGDFPKRSQRGRSQQSERVTVDGRALRIQSRTAGEAVSCTYELQSYPSQLRRSERDSTGRTSHRLLMADIADWRIDLSDKDADGNRALTVELEAIDGRTLSRRYRLP